jgi:hypothetical protein
MRSEQQLELYTYRIIEVFYPHRDPNQRSIFPDFAMLGVNVIPPTSCRDW